MDLRVSVALLNANIETPRSLGGNSGNIGFHLRCYRVFEARDFADDDTPWIRIHGLIVRRRLIFQIIRNKPVTVRSRSPRVIAVAVIVDANTRALCLSLSLFTSVSTSCFPPGFLLTLLQPVYGLIPLLVERGREKR